MSELLEASRPQIIRGRRECRMRVAPVAACAAKSTGVSNYRYTATAGIPCTMVLTVSFVLSPVTMLGCHRHQWNRFHQLSACIGAPGPHDFAVRTNTARRAIIALGDVRPSHPIPNVRDDREPPLLWKRDKRNEATDLGVRSISADRDRLARRAKSAYRPCDSGTRGSARPKSRTIGSQFPVHCGASRRACICASSDAVEEWQVKTGV